MQNTKELSIMANATKTATKTATPVKENTAIPDPTTTTSENADQAENTVNTEQAIANLVEDITASIEYAQKTLDGVLGYEWKGAARKYIKAIAEYHAGLIGLRDKVTADNLGEVATSVEAILDGIEAAIAAVKTAKPTESESAAFTVLHGSGHLVIDGEEYLIPSEGIAIVRYTRQTPKGQVSVLFTAPTQGSALLPIGLITSDTVKRFADVRLTPENQKAIAQAKAKWCESFKAAVKADKLTQKEQDVAQRFKSAGFSRI